MSRTPFSAAQVLALSPDAASSKAAQGLVSPGKWPLLGASDAAVWGACQGSGSKPYQTQVDVSAAGPTFRCSCPSRKFPCKHGLALLLLQAQYPLHFNAPEPTWVSEWLSSRQERADKKEAKASAAPVAPNPKISAQREAKRVQRMTAGAQELALWLHDLSRQGLASLSTKDQAVAATLGARMVDAQAPALAQRLTHALSVIGQGSDWPSRLLARLGKLQLLLDAVAQPQRLTPALQADVYQALGWPLERDEVLTQGEHLEDDWQVIAQVRLEREARLTERRVWLHGQRSQRRALLLDFSFAGKAFDSHWLVGTQRSGSVAFYPGADPTRALWIEASSAAPPTTPASWPHAPDHAREWRALSARIAANPWAWSWPLCLGSVFLQPPSEAQTVWRLQSEQATLPLSLSASDAWLLMAFAGGAPVSVFGEWNGEVLRPLSAWNASGHWSAAGMTGEM